MGLPAVRHFIPFPVQRAEKIIDIAVLQERLDDRVQLNGLRNKVIGKIDKSSLLEIRLKLGDRRIPLFHALHRGKSGLFLNVLANIFGLEQEFDELGRLFFMLGGLRDR